MRKTIVVMFLVTLISGAACKGSENMTDETQNPLETVRCEIASTQSEFLAVIEQFADENEFAIRVGRPRGPEAPQFLIQLWREDINLIGVNPFEPKSVRLSFYSTRESYVPKDEAKSLSAELMKRLEEYGNCIKE